LRTDSDSLYVFSCSLGAVDLLIRGFSLQTGAEIWSQAIPDISQVPKVIVVEGDLIVFTNDHKVFMVDRIKNSHTINPSEDPRFKVYIELEMKRGASVISRALMISIMSKMTTFHLIPLCPVGFLVELTSQFILIFNFICRIELMGSSRKQAFVELLFGTESTRFNLRKEKYHKIRNPFLAPTFVTFEVAKKVFVMDFLNVQKFKKEK
jgi:hypothetical protein